MSRRARWPNRPAAIPGFCGPVTQRGIGRALLLRRDLKGFSRMAQMSRRRRQLSESSDALHIRKVGLKLGKPTPSDELGVGENPMSNASKSRQMPSGGILAKNSSGSTSVVENLSGVLLMAKSRRLPYMKWFPRDWLFSTRLMSLAERGAYFDLLNYQWDMETLPSDPNDLAKLVGCTPAEFAPIWQKIRHKFVTENGGFQNPRMEEHKKDVAKIAANSRKNGRKGGRPRAKPTGLFLGNPDESISEVIVHSPEVRVQMPSSDQVVIQPSSLKLGEREPEIRKRNNALQDQRQKDFGMRLAADINNRRIKS